MSQKVTNGYSANVISATRKLSARPLPVSLVIGAGVAKLAVRSACHGLHGSSPRLQHCHPLQ